ncbi:hypothetical protein [Nocardioides acrostichi]|uniref:Uncharacterized protein n=1 Tax=Nocardioides acrostichi TaxID=2784339 RepID=A0A930Y820_9ACTN|nr:hypothetical protein [Nocardioides acrostichi]MBF4162591.1 hypothetical protein [Nocardioides acrostichi]
MSALGCKYGEVDLSLLHDLVAARENRWQREGFEHEFADGPMTDKPASWLRLDLRGALGQLTVWVSGEAEMDWGMPDKGGERHYDLSSVGDLERCVDDLERRLWALAR